MTEKAPYKSANHRFRWVFATATSSTRSGARGIGDYLGDGNTGFVMGRAGLGYGRDHVAGERLHLAQRAGALLVQLERDLMGIVAALLAEAGVAERWEEAGVTVAELSEQLLMSAKGIKASVDTLAAYRERMLTAIRIVMRSP